MSTVQNGANMFPTSGISGQTTMMHGVGSVGGSGNMGGFGPAAIGSTAGAAGGPSQFNQMLSNGANTDMLFASIGEILIHRVCIPLLSRFLCLELLIFVVFLNYSFMFFSGLIPDQIGNIDKKAVLCVL